MSGESTGDFYDALAEYYHLIFEDWELSSALEREGFGEIRWLMPHETGYYQPAVLALWDGRG